MLAHRHCRRWTGRALLYGFNTFKGGVGGQFVGRDLGITNCTLNFPRLPSIAEILRVGRSRELAVYQGSACAHSSHKKAFFVTSKDGPNP